MRCGIAGIIWHGSVGPLAEFEEACSEKVSISQARRKILAFGRAEATSSRWFMARLKSGPSEFQVGHLLMDGDSEPALDGLLGCCDIDGVVCCPGYKSVGTYEECV